MKEITKTIMIILVILIVTLLSLYAYSVYLAPYLLKRTPRQVVLKPISNESFVIYQIEVSGYEPQDYYLYEKRINYALTRENDTGGLFELEKGKLSEIRDNPSEGYNVTWLDCDRDHHLTQDDKILISKSGGKAGMVRNGDYFMIWSDTWSWLCSIWVGKANATGLNG
ncbi:MAG: hypothetical protein QXJ27_07195 [Thermoplasmata archaeon]